MRPPCHLHITNVLQHSPTWKKIIEISTIKDRGGVHICVTVPIYLRGPTNHWALHLPTPQPRGAAHKRLRGPAWPLATCARHLRLAWAMRDPTTWPMCRVASARWSRAPRRLAGALSLTSSVDKTTPFLRFKFRHKFNINSNLNPEKKSKTLEIHNLRNTTPF